MAGGKAQHCRPCVGSACDVLQTWLTALLRAVLQSSVLTLRHPHAFLASANAEAAQHAGRAGSADVAIDCFHSADRGVSGESGVEGATSR